MRPPGFAAGTGGFTPPDPRGIFGCRRKTLRRCILLQENILGGRGTRGGKAPLRPGRDAALRLGGGNGNPA